VEGVLYVIARKGMKERVEMGEGCRGRRKEDVERELDIGEIREAKEVIGGEGDGKGWDSGGSVEIWVRGLRGMNMETMWYMEWGRLAGRLEGGSGRASVEKRRGGTSRGF